ncbi:hypothetical protein POM88_023331 [Heracleum sosnowskyi]|uniref:Uncharacterized protein n=1 Tax=Heracleum sosnowskyi TaxID=360622 RepID=A0AAD8IHF5_9APIA|nr:hypothetical protein POM88_023331 [Heracleum sosnowskyi]
MGELQNQVSDGSWTPQGHDDILSRALGLGDAAGSFVEWPKDLVTLGQDPISLEKNKGGLRNNRKEFLWHHTEVQCPQQEGGTECGFYVMRVSVQEAIPKGNQRDSGALGQIFYSRMLMIRCVCHGSQNGTNLQIIVPLTQGVDPLQVVPAPISNTVIPASTIQNPIYGMPQNPEDGGSGL